MRFKIINEYENYIIFENGSILNCITDRFLVINNGKDFYRTVRLNKNGVAKTYKLHRLLAEAFRHKPFGSNYVNHIDGNKLNNHISNLEWCTHKENMQHARKIGLTTYQEIHRISLLKSKQKPVLNINNGIFYDSIKEARLIYGFNNKKVPSNFIRI
jgi:hypothetical protein